MLCIARLVLLSALCSALLACAGAVPQPRVPKLIVVVSYDQFRGDYPDRWRALWSERGFNRMEREGVSFPQCFFGHANNMTGPGHAVQLTGVYPAKHGIVSNELFDRTLGYTLNCVEDSTAPVLAAPGAKYGVSPRLLAAPTLGDVLRARFPTAKVIGISGKDRGAVLMAGQKANLALWIEPAAGGFTTSSYYTDTLPAWLQVWRTRRVIESFAGYSWTQALPDDRYTMSDNLAWEGRFPGGDRAFPHELPVWGDTFWYPFLLSPFAIETEFDLAATVVREEHLGRDSVPDLLCISVSSTDYVGHQFGPDSRELQDIFYHADRILGEFIDLLDREVGRDRYVLVVTSDHGVGPVPESLLSDSLRPRIDAGRLRAVDLLEDADLYLDRTFPTDSTVKWFRAFEPPSLFFDERAVAASGVSLSVLADSLRAFLSGVEGVGIVVTAEELRRGHAASVSPEVMALILNTYYPQRTGDIVLYPRPYWIYGSTPATHGTPYDYDRHVPLMLLGGGITAPATNRTMRTSPADIAPTLARLLGVNLPGTDGTALPVAP